MIDQLELPKQILSFLKGLEIKARIPKGIETLNPYTNRDTFALCEAFYKKYYHDSGQRILMLGINPGRFGSGTTGISFTDPIKLESICGIKNNLVKKPELSADFIYKMIGAYGGPEIFYKKFLISAISPLGFTANGKNINYYDVPALQKAVMPFVVSSLNAWIQMNVSRDVCFCIGEGKNHKFLTALNNEHQWFKSIVPLAHPRFIMQYRRKRVDEYVEGYLSKLV